MAVEHEAYGAHRRVMPRRRSPDSNRTRGVRDRTIDGAVDLTQERTGTKRASRGEPRPPAANGWQVGAASLCVRPENSADRWPVSGLGVSKRASRLDICTNLGLLQGQVKMSPIHAAVPTIHMAVINQWLRHS